MGCYHYVRYHAELNNFEYLTKIVEILLSGTIARLRVWFEASFPDIAHFV